MDQKLLPSRNEGWGFHGTASIYADAELAWTMAFMAISKATGAGAEAVRDFLDSRHGRHLADDVANGVLGQFDLKAAVDTAVARWMDWTISRAMARSHGIPQGLPYLVGLVAQCEIEAEIGADEDAVQFSV